VLSTFLLLGCSSNLELELLLLLPGSLAVALPLLVAAEVTRHHLVDVRQATCLSALGELGVVEFFDGVVVVGLEIGRVDCDIHDVGHGLLERLEALGGRAVLDGELLVGHDFDPMNFNHLQQRLNRKTPAKSHIRDYPAFVRVYDMLFDGEEDIRDLPLVDRRRRLEAWMATHAGTRLDLSEILAFNDWDELAAMRRMGAETHGHEGLMIKQLQSLYVAGRPKGPWFKWKRDPRLIDTVMMYAQRGHGRRSSFYSDYTFGIWRGNEIVPVGKAYSGFTDGELRDLDKWVRGNTVNRFGPVREVEKDLVVELAFDSAHESPRHKSGIALRFPRVSRIRWDKPASEADTIETVRKLIG